MTRRLVVSYLVVTVFVLVVLEVPLGIVYQQREEDRLATAVERDATVLAGLYEDVLEAGSDPDPTVALDYAASAGARVVVTDAAGISVVDTAPDFDASRDFSTRDEIATALAGGRASGTRRSDTLDTDLLFVAVPVASGGNVWGALRVTLDAHEVRERVQRFWLGLVAVGLVVLAVMTGVGWAVARSVTRPIRRLQGAANRFAGGELAVTEPDERAPPEVRELEKALNVMATRLDALLGQQRAFVAEASHQLRTPLTAIRLRLENLHSTADSDEERGEIEASIAETTRLADLVDDLLRLARAERAPRIVVVDAAQVAAERVEVWGAVADDAGVTLRLDAGEAPVPVRVVDGGLEQVLDNLLDNAIIAAGSGGTVVVEVEAEHATLTVADDGPGLDDEAKHRAFDRFWRGRADHPGSGLGLAIVESLVESAGGTVSLADNQPRGLRVVVRFTDAPDRSTSPPLPRSAGSASSFTEYGDCR